MLHQYHGEIRILAHVSIFAGNVVLSPSKNHKKYRTLRIIPETNFLEEAVSPKLLWLVRNTLFLKHLSPVSVAARAFFLFVVVCAAVCCVAAVVKPDLGCVACCAQAVCGAYRAASVCDVARIWSLCATCCLCPL